MIAVLPVSVVVPTIGRPEQLQVSLTSIAECRPRAAEILVVDQSGDEAVAAAVGRFASAGARLVACAGRGVSRARNVGLQNAAKEIVLVTDDDCTVDRDWVGHAWRILSEGRTALVTGRVLPVGDPLSVPSTIDDPEPHDYTGERRGGLLFPNNMGGVRSALLAQDGGFDERFGPDEAAEDNEFCYRWLKDGNSLHYAPELVVYHHDWRSPHELELLYRRYARGEGFFYAKHLRQGDLRMLRFMARDLMWSVRGHAAAGIKHRPRWADPRQAILGGMPGGFRDGWRAFGSAGRDQQT